MESIKQPWNDTETKAFYESLLAKALESIPETGAAMVLGPMFIVRSPEENFALFNQAQDDLREEGIEVFDQVPFTDYKLGTAPFDYGNKFEIFYKQLINSGKITACYLLKDWEQSQGTKSEVEYCKDAGVPVFEL